MSKFNIRKLQLFDVFNLFNLFRYITEEDKKFFNPHKFDYEAAVRICTNVASSLDKYYVMTDLEGVIVGYGFLRGWQEGYDIPRLGMYISSTSRGIGLGKQLLKYLLEGCPSSYIQLKVHKDNFIAMDLYEGFGFYKSSSEKDYLILENNKDE